MTLAEEQMTERTITKYLATIRVDLIVVVCRNDSRQGAGQILQRLAGTVRHT